MKEAYKILIADDEYWVRKKLTSLLDWESLGLRCLEPAKDGLEALARVQEEHPDILVTDINMPFLNGIDLLEKIHTQQPEIITFVVSGYDDFDYVKGSFLSGGINYLLKPVSREDMENAVVRALEIISHREDTRRKLTKAASLLQDTEFSQLVRDREPAALPTAFMEKYLGMDEISLMLVKIHNLAPVTRQYGHDMSLYSYAIKQDILALAGSPDLISFNHIYRPGEFMILSEKGEAARRALAQKLLHYFGSYPEVCLTISMTPNIYTIDRIHIAYREAVSGLLSRPFGKSSQILDVHAFGTGKSARLKPEIAKQALSDLQSENKSRVLRLLLDDSGLSSCEGWPYAHVMQLVKEIGILLSAFAAKHISGRRIADMESLTDSTVKAVESLDIRTVCDAIRTAVDYLLPEQKEIPVDTTRRIIRQAAAYIDENYFEDLTLSSLAEKYNMESTYFSRIFRQEMGETLIFYITRKRMEKAQHYIAGSHVNLTEIAFLVGYNDYSYFNRVFKKHTGMSPREYRNQFRAEEA